MVGEYNIDSNSLYQQSFSEMKKLHFSFTDMLNNADSFYNASESIEKSGLQDLICALDAYAIELFKLEEAFMEQCAYPDLFEMIKEHLFFVNKVNTFKRDRSFNPKMMFYQVLVFMKKWELCHNKIADTAFFRYVKDNYSNHV